MGADEVGTLAALKAIRREIVDPAIAEHKGRIVKTTGDGLLVEFGSAVDAVTCAMAVQELMAKLDDNGSKISFRIGINVGDIIIDDGDIFGDGVNIAARLEGLAEPGGICISGTVYDQIGSKLDLSIEDLGQQSVKNIARPVRTYRMRLERPAPTRAEQPKSVRLTDKPSIAVLPFDNMSGDPKQEYFVDGITEDIITGLSRIRQFFVIARNSTFQYKGRAPDIRDVARDLRVRYVLEGSVRKAGDKLRITSQLIDGETGNHIWAERYDRKLEDIFAVQDEITQTVVGAIEPELGRAEYERVRAKTPGNLSAWEAFHRGMALVSRRIKDANAEARELFAQAIDLDPEFAPAHAGIAWSLAEDLFFRYVDHDPDECLRIARRAVELDDKDTLSYFALGWALTYVKKPQEAIEALRKAIAINPSYAHAHAIIGRLLAHTGKAEEAIAQMETAFALSPADPSKPQWLSPFAAANLYLENHENAIRYAKICVQTFDTWPAWMIIVSAAGHLGDARQIEEARKELQRRQPGISITYVRDNYVVFHQPYLDYLLDGLRKAGLPE